MTVQILQLSAVTHLFQETVPGLVLIPNRAQDVLQEEKIFQTGIIFRFKRQVLLDLQ